MNVLFQKMMIFQIGLEEITKQTKNILLGFADKPLNEVDSYKIDNVNLLGFNSPSINIDVESQKINIMNELALY